MEGALTGEAVKLLGGIGLATLRTLGGTIDGRASLETGVGATSIDCGRVALVVVGALAAAGASSILSMLVSRSTSPSGITTVLLAEGSFSRGLSSEVRGAAWAANRLSCFSLINSLATLAAKMAPGLSSGCESYSCSFQRPSKMLTVVFEGCCADWVAGFGVVAEVEGVGKLDIVSGPRLAATWGGRSPVVGGTMRETG